MVVRGHFGRKKNEYRYLTYKTIIENLTNQQIRYLHVNYKD